MNFSILAILIDEDEASWLSPHNMPNKSSKPCLAIRSALNACEGSGHSPPHSKQELKQGNLDKEVHFLKVNQTAIEEQPYISPNELARRWQCSRASVDRITRRAGIKRLCLGTGTRNSFQFSALSHQLFGNALRCLFY